MIKFENISYKYPRGVSVLHDVSMEFDRGAVTALTGRNGCGKTTLTKLLVGILRPDGGCVTVDGCDIRPLDLFEIGQRVGYVFQNANKQLFCPTVYDEVAFGLKNKGLPESEVRAQTEEFLARFHIEKYSKSYPGSLSEGEKQRVVLAAVLALGTDYLVLDEPTAGLDVRARHELGKSLEALAAERGCGIIIVSHERAFIERYAGRETVLP